MLHFKQKMGIVSIHFVSLLVGSVANGGLNLVYSAKCTVWWFLVIWAGYGRALQASRTFFCVQHFLHENGTQFHSFLACTFAIYPGKKFDQNAILLKFAVFWVLLSRQLNAANHTRPQPSLFWKALKESHLVHHLFDSTHPLVRLLNRLIWVFSSPNSTYIFFVSYGHSRACCIQCVFVWKTSECSWSVVLSGTFRALWPTWEWDKSNPMELEWAPLCSEDCLIQWSFLHTQLIL